MAIITSARRTRIVLPITIHFFVVAAFVAICSFPAVAQITQITSDTSTPVPNTGKAYLQMGNEVVNPEDGSLSIRIDVPMPKGRELTVPFSFAYDSNSTFYAMGLENIEYGPLAYSGPFPGSGPVSEYFYESLDWVSHSHFLAKAGWAYSVPLVSQVTANEYAQFNTGEGANPIGLQNCIYKTGYIFYDPEGGRHDLGMTHYDPSDAIGIGGPPAPQQCFTDSHPNNPNGGDAAVLSQLEPEDPLDSVLVADADGTTYHFPILTESFYGLFTNAYIGMPDQIEDRNGNKVTVSDQGKGAFTYTDTLGKAVLTSSGFGSSGNTVTVAGLGNPYTVQWGTYSPTGFSTNFDPVLQPKYCLGFEATTPGNHSGISSIKLPNLQSFSFGYDSVYGLVNEIDYPTGGRVLYTWGANSLSAYILYDHIKSDNHWISPPDAPDAANNPFCEANYDKFAIQTRDVYDGQTHVLNQTFTYTTAPGGSSRWTQKTTTVTTKDLIAGTTSTTVYTYVPNADLYPVESTVVTTQGGSTVQTINKSWYSGNSNPFLDSMPLVACEQVSNDDNSLASLTTYSYTPEGGQVAQKNEYASGSCPASYDTPNPNLTGTLLRSTSTVYANLSPTPLFPLFSSILDRPSSVIVKDGSGNEASESDYAYDETAVTAISATNHDEGCYAVTPTSTCGKAVGGPTLPTITSVARGNATTITHKCFIGSTACTNVTAGYTYYETGQVSSLKDSLGNITSYSYLDSPSSVNAAGQSNAYLTTVTRPTTNKVAHISSYQYNYTSGELAASTDENSQPTTYSYSDPLLRLTDIYGPPSPQNNNKQPHTNYAYVDGVGSTVTTTNPIGVISVSLLDGFGRAKQTQLTTDPCGTDYVDTQYDGMGHVYTVSNPYRSNSICAAPSNGATATNGTTTYTYDALGRTTSVMHPDKSSLITSYSGNVTTSKDENGNSWSRTSDALGRLINVVEPSGAKTGYTYNALDNLLTVNQNGVTGDTPRTRNFAYDSLSRLLCASNPENSPNLCPTSATATMPSGVTSYAYDANGNFSSKTDPRGITTNYSYDTLNRLLSKTYTNDTTGTASSCYQYDGASTANLIGRLTNQWTQPPSLGVCAASPPSTKYLSLRSILAYDSMGRVQSEQQCTKSNCTTVTPTPYKQAYTYDLAGNILQHGNGVGTMTFTNCYDAANHLLSVVNGGTTCPATLSPSTTLFSATGYSPAGGLAAATFGTGLNLSRTYDSRLRVTGETDIGNATTSTTGAATLTITGTEHVQ